MTRQNLSEELVPYNLDDRIVWAFLRGINGSFGVRDIDNMAHSLDTPGAKTEFVTGLVQGAYSGSRLVIDEYIRSTAELLKAISNWTLEFYTTVYDWKLIENIINAWIKAPNAAEQTKAITVLADIYQARHPAGSAALGALAEVSAVLEEIAKWLKQRHVIGEILVALARDLGKLLDDELNQIRSLTGRPKELGHEIGNVIGQTITELTLLLLGV